MKKNTFVIIMILLFATSSTILAQRGKRQGSERTPEERAEKMTNKMAEELSLTASQKEQVYAINLEATKQGEDLRNKVRSGAIQRGNGELREVVKRIEQDRDTKITAVLDASQKVKYEELKSNRKAKIQERRGRGNLRRSEPKRK